MDIKPTRARLQRRPGPLPTNDSFHHSLESIESNSHPTDLGLERVHTELNTLHFHKSSIPSPADHDLYYQHQLQIDPSFYTKPDPEQTKIVIPGKILTARHTVIISD